MATDRIRIVVEVVLADPGGWCDRCSLPSVLVAHCVLHLGRQEAHSMASIRYCETCGPVDEVSPASLGFG